MKVGSIIGLACVAIGGIGAAGTLTYLATHRPQPLDLPRTAFVNEFTLGRNQVQEYRLDNRDGNGLKKIVASLEAQGGKRRISDGFLVFDMSPNRSVSVQVPPTYLGTFKGKARYRSAGGREYDLHGRAKPNFDHLQLNVVTVHSELLTML